MFCPIALNITSSRGLQQRVFVVLLVVAATCLTGMLANAGPLPLTTTANGLLGGLTKYDLNNYESVYDANGNVVTSGSGAALIGDTIQGVFVVNSVSNQYGTANYAPNAGGVQLTGIFDELITGTDAAGNFILAPDNSLTVGAGTNGKAMSGAAFQASYGSGSMIAVFQNNGFAMNTNVNGAGLQGLTTAQALALATTGSEWASFGAKGAWGDPNGYYWTAPANASIGNGTFFAASLGIIQPPAGVPTSSFLPLNQSPPSGSNFNTDSSLFAIANSFIIQGTLNPTSQQLAGTPYELFSTDPVQVDVVPEPCGLGILGASFGLWVLVSAAVRRMRRA